MASSPRINTQLGARQTLELRRKARLPVHRPSACSGDLIAGDGTKNGLSRSEQKTVSTTQNNRLTGKAPYKSTANLPGADDIQAKAHAGGADRRGDRSRVFVRLAPHGFPPFPGRIASSSRPPGRVRAGVPTRHAAGCC